MSYKDYKIDYKQLCLKIDSNKLLISHLQQAWAH